MDEDLSASAIAFQVEPAKLNLDAGAGD